MKNKNVETIKASAPVKAADGAVEGKPTMHNRIRKMSVAVQKAAQADDRFKISGQSQYMSGNPYVVDVTVPDDDGKHHAVIRKGNGDLVKHGFDYDADADTATLDAGDSQPTECTTVYTRLCEQHDEICKAGGPGSGPHSHGNDVSKHASDGSEEANKASAKAFKSGDASDHRDAADAHAKAQFRNSAAADASEKSGDKEGAASHQKLSEDHAKAATMHQSIAMRGQAVPGRKTLGDVSPAFRKMTDNAKKAMHGSNSSRTDTVHCRVAVPVKVEAGAWQQDVPVPIMWMPKGVTTVTAGFRDRSLELTVDCGDETAETVQASLENWLESNDPQKPMICIEHREQESAGWPVKFEKRDDGVYCSVSPSGLGADNVNKKIHRSFSPSFTTDADYAKCTCASCKQPVAKCADCTGMLKFPEGVRGSKTNPANVTGVGDFSIGSLTNRPAFRNIAPVKASEPKPKENEPAEAPKRLTVDDILASSARQASPPETQKTGHNQKGNMIKLEIIKARDKFKVGDVLELEEAEAGTLLAGGVADRHENMETIRAMRKEKTDRNKARITASVTAAKTRCAIPPKDEDVLKAALAQFERFAGSPNEEDGVMLIVEAVDSKPGKDLQEMTRRTVKAQRDNSGFNADSIDSFSGESLYDTCINGYVKAREGMNKLIRESTDGGQDAKANMVKATSLAGETSRRLARVFKPIIRAGDDVSIMDIVRAADTTDANVGTIATGLILMRNLGFLKNKLGWMPYISTDLRNEPALYNQPVFTRYITPPATVQFDTTNGWVAQTPSTTDVTVTINQHYGVPINFQTQLLGSTVRALFAEQQGAQIYSLAEKVNTQFLTTLFAATWSGTIASYTKALANFNITSLVDLKLAMTIGKVPDVGRFALLHSAYHDALLRDSNLILANTLMAALGRDSASYNTGELPILFGIKPLESQLAAATNGVLAGITDPNNLGPINQVGFAGNMSSMLFVSRIPQDYTTVLPGIPATAAIEIITDPDSGLSMMFTKYIDHKLASTTARVSLMWGSAQGDPRQGLIIKPV